MHTFNAHNDDIESILITTDEKYIISGSYDKKIKLWNIESKMME